MTVDRITRVRNRWSRLSTFPFDPIPSGQDATAWVWATVAAGVVAASVPTLLVAPTLGHLLFTAQFAAILLPATRAGWRGALGGLLLSLTGLTVALAATSFVTAAVPLDATGLLLMGSASILLTLFAGGLGESMMRERRLANQLANTEGRLSTLINAMPTGLVVVDRIGKIVFSNREARQMLAADAPEDFGISLRDLVAEGSWQELRQRLVSTRREEPLRVTIPGETPLRTEWVCSTYVDGGVNRTLAFFWNAEEKLIREEEAGALTAALRCLQEGVILANLDGTIRYANPAAAQIYGHADRTDFIGTSLLEHVAEQDLDGYEARMERARTTGGEGEIHLRRPDGGETEVHITTSPVNVDGALIGTIGVIRDLTATKVLARRALAADKQATLGRMVAGAAHEINNPLAAILITADLLHEQVGPGTDAAAQVEVIQTECARAGRIVRDLLAFARQRPVSRSASDLADVVRTALALREGYIRAAGIELTLDTPSPAPVLVDVDQIKQVVLNLIVNAEDAVAASATRRICVTIGRRGGRALLMVNDSGPGVPDEIQQQIFEPFFTTKPEGLGTGLGLAVSLGIVSEHGGRVTVSRGVLGGAQFSVELPLALAPDLVAPLPCPQVAPRVGARLRILVVDDEPSILRSVGRILQRLGHDVRTAPGGGDALALALTESFDVVISDLRMPGMSGRELHAELTKEGILPATDFIVATGDIADPEGFAFLQATGLPVLLKPFEIRDLVEMLGRCRAAAPQPELALAG